jgi:ribosome-associated protein
MTSPPMCSERRTSTVEAASRYGAAAWRFRQDQGVATVHEIQITGETIRLGQLLKLSGIAESGGASKALLVEGVRVNGVPETRRGRQLHDGDVVEARGETARVVVTGTSPSDRAPRS